VNGAYFWRFLESVPEQFRVLSENNQTESFLNESLEAVMIATRLAYQACFTDTTMENSCAPPLTCTLDFETCTFSVTEALS